MMALESVYQQLMDILPWSISPLLCFALAVFLIWNLVLSFRLWQTSRWIKRVFGGTEREDLKEILEEHIERVGVVQIKLNDLEAAVKEIRRAGLEHIQKIGMVRFNPFDDTGGDQSFVVAILDANDNGLVISSLHSRERTRIYAKPVEGGNPEKYPFSKEEEEAVRRAQQP